MNLRIVEIILIALSIGFLRALYGSGILKHYSSLLNKVLEWLVIPLAMGIAGYYYQGLVGLLLPLPYLWKQATGTGGDMQAQWNNPINNPHEWEPFDWIARKVTILNLNFDNPQNSLWCRVWGLWYCQLTSIIFILPFLATQKGYLATPLLLYPFFVRYLPWRIAGELGLYSLYVGLFLYA